MKFWSFIKQVFYILVACSVLVFFVIFITFHLTTKHQCNVVADIARNEKIINYLDQWTHENILDKGYSFVFGMGRISAKKGDEFINISPLPDANITNIELGALRFNISKKAKSFESPYTSENVTSIEFGWHRDTIIILKNGELITSYRGDDVKSGHLKKVRDNVYAYCANSTF